MAFRHSGDFSALSPDRPVTVSPKPPKSPHVRSPSKPASVAGQNVNASNNVNCYMQRESGVIEKLLVCATYKDNIYIYGETMLLHNSHFVINQCILKIVSIE